MVHFFLKKYIQTVKSSSSLLLLAFVPVLAYLLYAASQYDHFTTYQEVSVNQDAPIALSGSPTDTAPVSAIVPKSDDFFLNSFALSELFRLINPGTPRDVAKNNTPTLAGAVGTQLTMTQPNDSKVRITFRGRDLQQGEKMVIYFAGRLVKKAQEGQRRTIMQSGSKPMTAVQDPASLSGPLEVQGDRTLFRLERLVPCLVLFGVGLLIILIWLACQELLDPSFKSERQAARYLELNSLGTLPDLGAVSKTIGTGTEG